MKMVSTSIKTHKIYLEFSDEINLSAREIMNAKRELRSPNFTKKQVKINRLQRYLYEIEDKLEDINIGRAFLNSPSALGRVYHRDVLRSNYIKYHKEFYYINIIAIFDRALHLINFLYNLGIADRHVKKDIILTNENINKELIKKMNAFDKSLKFIRETQNISKHKEKIYIPELYNAELLELTLKHWEVLKKIKRTDLVHYHWTKKEEKELKADAIFYYKNYLKEERVSLETINKNLLSSINDILDLLYPLLKVRITDN